MSVADLAATVGIAAIPAMAYLVWRRPAAGIAALVLTVSAPWEMDLGSSAGVTAWPIDLLSVLVVGVIVARALTLGDPWLPKGLAALLAACLLAGVVATIGAHDAFTSLGGLVRFTQAFVLIPLAVVLALADRRDQRLLLGALIATGVFQSAVAVVQFMTGTGASFTPPGGETSDLRGIGTFNADQIMAMPTIVTAALIASVAIVLWGDRRDRPIALAVLPLLSAGLVVSLARGAWIAAAVGILVLLVLKSWRLALAVAVSGLALVAAAALALPAGDPIRERADSLVDTASDPDASVESRYALWDTAVAIWVDHPVDGVGIKGFVEYRDPYTSLDLFPGSDISDPAEGFRVQELESPHSLYLQILSEQGLMGMVAYGVLLATTLIAGFRVLRTGDLGGSWNPYVPFTFAVMAWLVSFLTRSAYGDVGGPTVAFDGIFLGAAMMIAFGEATARGNALAESSRPLR